MTRKEAIEIAYEMGGHPYSLNSMVDAMMKGVEIGKKEQKAIDDELLKRVHKGVLDKAIKEKKELIDKACEWLINHANDDWDFGGGIDEVTMVSKFRKVLKEK